LLTDLRLIPESREYKLDEADEESTWGSGSSEACRESFIPDVWTVAWEDNDKMVPHQDGGLPPQGRAPGEGRSSPPPGKEVRRAKFYWSRDPDLPYRIWTAIIHEDGSAPITPRQRRGRESPSSWTSSSSSRCPLRPRSAGARHRVVGSVDVAWGRRSYLEKGSPSRGRRRPVELRID
jgi:hypothetical protein